MERRGDSIYIVSKEISKEEIKKISILELIIEIQIKFIRVKKELFQEKKLK